jgi:Tol biopolymer transport system component
MFAKGWLIPERTLASVSPDGAMLFVEKHSGTGMDIATASLDSGAQTRPLVQGHGDDVDPTVSPDGRWLAYSAASGKRQLFVQPYPQPGVSYYVAPPMLPRCCCGFARPTSAP